MIYPPPEYPSVPPSLPNGEAVERMPESTEALSDRLTARIDQLEERIVVLEERPVSDWPTTASEIGIGVCSVAAIFVVLFFAYKSTTKYQ